MPRGNGAYVVHKLLESRLPGYVVRGYDPRWTFFPPALRAFADARADLVHTTPDYAVFVRSPRVPLVVTFHGFVLDGFMTPYASLAQRLHYRFDLRWWTDLALARAFAVTAVSHFTAGLVKGVLGYPGEVRVIHDGVDADRFTPGTERTGLDGKVNVLFSGNLTRSKGAHLLPEIADLLAPNVRILYTQGLRGHGRLAPHPRLECVGSVPFEAMPELYRSVDILVSPTAREAFGLNVAEAMACGLPAVATGGSSIPELLDHGRGGFLCPLDDARGFAEALNTLAASPAMRRDMGAYNRAKVEREFTLGRMAAEYRSLFEQALDRR